MGRIEEWIHKHWDMLDYIAWIIAVMSVMSFLSGMIMKGCTDNNEIRNAVKDTVIMWRDPDSLLHIKTPSVVSENQKEFVKMKTNDEEIKKLQALVKKYKQQISSATNIVDKVDYSVKTITIVKGDSLYPTYIGKFHLGNWVVGTSEATRDSMKINLHIRNEYTVLIVPDKRGLFRKQTAMAEVINKNPYANNTDITSFQVDMPKPKKFGLGISAGYGIGSNGLTPYIGIGLNYNLINF